MCPMLSQGPMADVPHLSHHLLELAREFELPLVRGRSGEMTDEQFLEFRGRYLEWAADRDTAALMHLAKGNFTLFRVYLSSSPQGFATAKQIVWYVDEVVMPDPLWEILEPEPEGDFEASKHALRERLQTLADHEGALASGLVVLFGRPLLGRIPDRLPSDIVALAALPPIKDGLIESAYCGYDVRRDSTGHPWDVYQTLWRFDWQAVFLPRPRLVPPVGNVVPPHVEPGERLPQVTPQELASRFAGTNPFDTEDAHYTYGREVMITLGGAEVARRLDAAFLTHRDVDMTILAEAHFALDPQRQPANVQIMNFLAPYLVGVPSERLGDLRDAMPSAFLAFRARLFELVRDAMRAGQPAGPELATFVDAKIVPELQQLTAEATAAARSTRLVGHGVPLLVSVAALMGWIGPGKSLLPSLVPMKSAADSAKEEARLTGNPFYFLWRA